VGKGRQSKGTLTVTGRRSEEGFESEEETTSNENVLAEKCYRICGMRRQERRIWDKEEVRKGGSKSRNVSFCRS